MTTKPVKLSEAQRAVLQAALDSNNCGLDYYDVLKAGGNGRTTTSLANAGYLHSRWFANGQFWELTVAGRAALENGNAD